MDDNREAGKEGQVIKVFTVWRGPLEAFLSNITAFLLLQVTFWVHYKTFSKLSPPSSQNK